MGAHPYWYFTMYDDDLDRVLQALRLREFEAGHYNPVISFPEFPINPGIPEPGAGHKTIEEALEDAGADGTRSILDIEKISNQSGFCLAAPLNDDVLNGLFGTTKPTHEMVEMCFDIFEIIERGQCIYIIIYKNGKPNEVFFAGYSFD